jgi:hypothetical protein
MALMVGSPDRYFMSECWMVGGAAPIPLPGLEISAAPNHHDYSCTFHRMCQKVNGRGSGKA